MVRSSEQAGAAAIAREDQGAGGGAAVEQPLELVVGRRCIPHLELGGGAHLDQVTDGDGAVARIAPEHVADEKVARPERRLRLVDYPPEVHPAGQQLSILLVETA